MKHLFNGNTLRTALCGLGLAVLLAGCGLGNPAARTSSAPSEPGATFSNVGGRALGGNQPIVNGTVNIYETASTGVASNGVYVPSASLTPLNSAPATTNATGNFNFSPAVSCSSSSDYTYITISGGSAGGTGTNNPNTLLMAYSGPCVAIQAFTWVNEVTTVASAYALSGFTSINAGKVSVTSSATNYATVVANPYGGTSTYGTATLSTAGLAHAVLNAQNLANFGGATGTTANTQGTLPGQANTTITTLNSNVGCGGGCTPATGNTQTAYMPASVPQAEINTIADALQACVNSNGGSATAGATSIAFSTPVAATSTTGGTSTLTATGSNTLTGGSISLGLSGAPVTTINVSADTSLSTLAAAINANSTYAAEGITAAVASGVLTVTGPNNATSENLSFSTPTTPTVTTGSTATIYGVTSANGTVSISLAGGAPLTGTVTAVDAPSFVTSFNGNASFSGAGIVASASGSSVIVTGPVGATNTLNFAGTSLTGTQTQTLTATATALIQDADDGTVCGKLFGYTPSLAGTIPTNTLQAALNLAHNPYANGAAPAIFNLVAASSGAPFTPTLSSAPADWSISIVYTAEYQAPSASATATYPYWIASDANDNVYSVVMNVFSGPNNSTATSLYSIASNGTLNYATGGATTGQTCPGTSCTMNSTTSNVTTTPAIASMTLQDPYDIATDGFANIWFPTSGSSSPTYPIYQVNASTGNVIQLYNGMQSTMRTVAADRRGDIWMGRNTTPSATNALAEFQYSGSGLTNLQGTGTTVNPLNGVGACTTCGTPYGPYASNDKLSGVGYGFPGTVSGGVATPTTTSGPYGMTVDNNFNVWAANESSNGTTLEVLPAQTTTAVSTTCTRLSGSSTLTLNTYYGTYTNLAGSSTGYACAGSSVTNPNANPFFIVGTMSGSGKSPYGIAIDSNGNAWISPSNSSPTLEEFIPTYTTGTYAGGGVITGLGSSGAPNNTYAYGGSGTTARFPVADGAGNIFIPDSNPAGASIFEFNTSAAAFTNPTIGIQPCLVVSNACGSNTNTVGGTSGALLGAHRIAIDSTGSIWVAAGASAAVSSGFSNIVQIIGTAAPTWWAGASKPGMMP